MSHCVGKIDDKPNRNPANDISRKKIVKRKNLVTQTNNCQHYSSKVYWTDCRDVDVSHEATLCTTQCSRLTALLSQPLAILELGSNRILFPSGRECFVSQSLEMSDSGFSQAVGIQQAW